MARARVSDVLGNWHTVYEFYSTSSQDFYQRVEFAISTRLVPGVEVSRVSWPESSAASGYREYLRVSRGQYCFDICAAPFGTAYFFSWWFARRSTFSIIGTIACLAAFWLTWHFTKSLILTSIIAGGGFVLLGLLLERMETSVSPYLLGVPLLGDLWRIFFLPLTYYRLDTEAAFRDTLHTVVLQIVDELTQAKGIRALTEAERKPVLREFYRRR